jgi:hypothetical protein
MDIQETSELTLTASELLRLPPAERDSIMERAAILAEDLYRNDPSLTDFEAFEAEDLDDPTTPTG